MLHNRIFGLIVMIAALVVLSACAPVAPAAAPAGEPAPALTPVRIGTQPWIGYGPWWIAQDQGMFEKHGLQAELIDFVQDTEVNAAFAAGEMDAANLATHTAIKLFANGVDLRVVLLEDASYEADAIIAGVASTPLRTWRARRWPMKKARPATCCSTTRWLRTACPWPTSTPHPCPPRTPAPP